MAFQHDLLATALEYKFHNNPNYGKGIATKGGVLIRFHPDIGTWPTEAEQEQYVNEWVALPSDHPAKDLKADQRKRVAAANSVPELREILLELIG